MNIAGMVLGIIAIMFAWIPVVGFVSIPFVAVGLPLSYFGLRKSKRKKAGVGMAVAGLVTNLIALVVIVLWWFVLIGSLLSAGESTDTPVSIATAQAEPNAAVAGQMPVSTPTLDPKSIGKERISPAPLGVSVVHSNLEITVLDVQRDYQAEGVFSQPEDEHEWVVATLRIRNVSGDANETKTYNDLEFRMVGDLGNIYDDIFTPSTDMPLGSGEFFAGAEVIGDVVRQVRKDDAGLILIFSPPFQGSRYLSLE